MVKTIDKNTRFIVLYTEAFRFRRDYITAIEICLIWKSFKLKVLIFCMKKIKFQQLICCDQKNLFPPK